MDCGQYPSRIRPSNSESHLDQIPPIRPADGLRPTSRIDVLALPTLINEEEQISRAKKYIHVFEFKSIEKC